MNNDFKKSDLKVGMKVEFNNLNTGIVTVSFSKGLILECTPFGYRCLSDFLDDLTDTSWFTEDIMKVYDENGELIWEREI